MNRHPHGANYASVVVVGAGPTGLSMALGLARYGVRSLLLEKKPTTSRTSKAPGLHVRTREIFRQWGIEERFVEAGELWRSFTMHNVASGRGPMLSLSGFRELRQEHAALRERLREHVDTDAVEPHFGTYVYEAVGGVTLTLEGDALIRDVDAFRTRLLPGVDEEGEVERYLTVGPPLRTTPVSLDQDTEGNPTLVVGVEQENYTLVRIS